MGIAPEVFWSMSLIEWRAAVAGCARRHSTHRIASNALARCDLEALMRRFPDRVS